MKKRCFLWLPHRITEKLKAEKARNTKKKRLRNSRSTVSKQLVALRSSPRDNFHCFSVRLWTLFCRKLDAFGVVRVPQKCSVLLRKEQARNKNRKRKQKSYEAGDRSARSVSPAFLCCTAFPSSVQILLIASTSVSISRWVQTRSVIAMAPECPTIFLIMVWSTYRRRC